MALRPQFWRSNASLRHLQGSLESLGIREFEKEGDMPAGAKALAACLFQAHTFMVIPYPVARSNFLIPKFTNSLTLKQLHAMNKGGDGRQAYVLVL